MNKKFLIILFLLSCSKGKKSESRYDFEIPRETLKSIVTDLYLAGAAADIHPSKNKDSLKQVYHTEICKIYKLTSGQLRSYIEKLNESHEVNMAIQKEILDSLNALQKKFEYQQK